MPLVLVVIAIVGCRGQESASTREPSDRADSTIAVPSESNSNASGRIPEEAIVSARMPDLESAASPLTDLLARARSQLQPDSGTAAADAIFLELRRGPIPEALSTIAATLQEQRYQTLVSNNLAESGRLDGPTADSLVDALAALGIVTSQPEGQMQLEVSEIVLAGRLGRYLTPGMRSFLDLSAEEQVRPTAADASLMIPLDELAYRILSAEEWLRSYSEASLRDTMLSRYRRYLGSYLGGLDNTGAFDRQTGAVGNDWRRSWERFAGQFGDTESGKAVARYLALLRDSGYVRSREIDDFRRGLLASANVPLVR